MNFSKLVAVALLALLWTGPAAWADDAVAPEAASGFIAKSAVIARHEMVVAAHPLAAKAGLEILDQGGSAADAAIAVQLVLTLVEPQSSGIGGGAFLLHWDGRDLTAFDGRETAPSAAREDRFLLPSGQPMPFFEAVTGGRSVGVPGVLRLFEMVHRRHGRLPWARLFEPAIALAEQGFPLSERLHKLLAADDYLRARASSRDYFYRPDGTPKPVGTILTNPALAAVFRRIAVEGAQAFYSGGLAQDMVDAVREAGGDLGLEDLAAYRAIERAPICGPFRVYKVCGLPPPTSGGVTVLQMLAMLQNFSLPPRSAAAHHLLAEAGKLAFADRNRYIADPDFVRVPVAGLLDADYLAARAQLIDPDHALPRAAPGEPPLKAGERDSRSWRDGVSPDRPSTSHISIIDGEGHAVAMTTSVENSFGSRIMVRGFLLNNQLTDFSFRPTLDGAPVANRVEPGKRPRSAMAPTMAFGPDGKLVLVAGSPGGSQIIGFVVQTLVAVLDWRFDPQIAVSLPHVLNRNGPTEVEDDALRPGLEALGHKVVVEPMTSGLHVIQVMPQGLLAGGADPRREGVAVGE